MGHIEIAVNGKTVHVHKAIVRPEFGNPTVLVENQWDYVAMWLRRKSSAKALFYWEQARHFYHATQQLPKTSSPLTSYYCALNAIKALLISRRQSHGDYHGLTGGHTGATVHLQNEYVRLKGGGVLPALCSYLGEPAAGETYTLKELLYNLPFVHRAYTLTFTSAPELFVPVERPIFVRKERSSEAWFQCTIRDRRYQSERTVATIPGFEHDIGITEAYVIRRAKRFRWKRGDASGANIARLRAYHQGIRRRLSYIRGLSRLWYVNRSGPPFGVIDRNCTTLIFAVLHRLSELARYTPDRLVRHFDACHNWLLSEFLDQALDQLIDQVSAEITGADFMRPGYCG